MSVCVSLARTVIWEPLTARETENVDISFFWPLLQSLMKAEGLGTSVLLVTCQQNRSEPSVNGALGFHVPK